MTLRVAIIGSGISGLAAAHHLNNQAKITLYEAGDYFGGHTHTVDVELPGKDGLIRWGVDTGFLVFNERTYPELIGFFGELGIRTEQSDMSFSVQVPLENSPKVLQWNGASLNSVFAQRSNLLKPKFIGMLYDLMRFNHIATELAQSNQEVQLLQPLNEFLDFHQLGNEFRNWYLLPMLGCIWSCPTDQMLKFPVATMIRFCHNHGLLQVKNRPQWFTVFGGAKRYVEKITSRLSDARLNTPVLKIERQADGVYIGTADGKEFFDHVILATHSDTALQLLASPSEEEQRLLSQIRYQTNRAVLHTDASVMPEKKLAWAAWNYERARSTSQEKDHVCLHYWLNRLQPLPFMENVFVSLNPIRSIDRSKILGEFNYEHPVFDLAAIEAQKKLSNLQGKFRTWYAGAWQGYGFHEDGLKSGLAAAKALLLNPL
jgi:predicted NAD/FAD-binding protein